MLVYARELSQLLWYEPSQLSGLGGISQEQLEYIQIYIPQSVDGPRVARPSGGIRIPELGLRGLISPGVPIVIVSISYLQKHTTGGFETARRRTVTTTSQVGDDAGAV